MGDRILMTLPIDTNGYDFKYNKTLNEDVKLVGNEYGKYDLDMDNDDYVNVTGVNSLANACIIAILTRYNELKDNPTYNGFGCRVHGLIKDNQNKLTKFKIETYLTETLNTMRRVEKINYLKLKEIPEGYAVEFSITSINDEIVKQKVIL